MWFVPAFISAIISAVSLVYNKQAIKGISTALFTWALFVFPIPLLVLLIWRQGLPIINLAFLAAAGLAAFFFTISKTFTLHTIKQGLLSQIVPLKAFGSFFTYLFALLVLGENLSLSGLSGLILIMFGAYLLNLKAITAGILKPFKFLISERQSLTIISAMFLSSIVGVAEKISLKNLIPANPFFLLLVEDIFIGSLLTVYLFRKYHNFSWLKQAKSNFWLLLIAALLYSSLAIAVFSGFTSGPVALVTGVKKLEIVFVLLLSWLLFNDRPAKHTWMGTILMLCGAILVKLN